MQHFVPAYLLHSRPFSDSQLMLDLLVQGVGHIRLLARVKGRNSVKKKANLQPFSRLTVQYAGNGDIKYLNQYELEGLVSLKNKALYCGFYLNELTARLTPVNEPLDEIYELYHQHLTQLVNDEDYEPILRSFEFQLLEALGVGLDFSFDAHGSELKDDTYYQYQNELGWLSLRGSKRGLSGKQIQQIAQLDFSDKLTRTLAKQLARYLLNPLLGYKKLKSRELFGS
jgi:DNA repair protein RecO (recombination protein O)